MRKISIIYFSQSGNTDTVAHWIAEGAKTIPDTEVRLFNIRENEDPDQAYVESSDAVIFGTPTYLSNICWQIKKWLDTKRTYQLGGKLGAAFATENFTYGGGELAIMTLVNHMMVKGMMVYSGGSAFGQPYIHIGPTVVKDQINNYQQLCILYGSRIATQAHRLFDR